MGDYCVRIEKMTNGYEVEIKDPAIVKANAKRDLSAKTYTPYKDPMRSYVFTDCDAVLAFLKKNLDKALPDDEYASAFDVAAESSSDD